MAELGLSKMSEPQPLRIKKWSEVEKEKRKKKNLKRQSHTKSAQEEQEVKIWEQQRQKF